MVCYSRGRKGIKRGFFSIFCFILASQIYWTKCSFPFSFAHVRFCSGVTSDERVRVQVTSKAGDIR
jgi:hypothetical protein